MTSYTSMKKVLNYIVCAFIISYVLPSGIVAGVPIQNVLVVLAFFCSLTILVRKRYILDIIADSVYEIVIAIFGLIWCITGWYKGNSFCIQVFVLLYMGAFIILGMKYLLKYGVLDINMVMQSIYYMLLVKMVIKFVIEIVYIAGLLDYDGISQFYFQFFSTTVTTMTMDMGNIELVRIQEASDAIVFTLIPFYWFMPEQRWKKRIILIMMMGIYTFFVFSRIYIVEATVFVLIALIYYWKEIPRKQKMIGVSCFLATVTICAKHVFSMLKLRFFSPLTVESDTIRVIQMKELLRGSMDSFWIGHGMGSFLPYYIRNESFPFSYELEYLSFLYQLGIIGFALIIVGIIGIFLKQIYPFFRKNLFIVKVISVVGVGWFLIRPFLNPSFLGKQNQFLLIGIFFVNVWYNSEESLCAMKGKES